MVLEGVGVRLNVRLTTFGCLVWSTGYFNYGSKV